MTVDKDLDFAYHPFLCRDLTVFNLMATLVQLGEREQTADSHVTLYFCCSYISIDRSADEVYSEWMIFC